MPAHRRYKTDPADRTGKPAQAGRSGVITEQVDACTVNSGNPLHNFTYRHVQLCVFGIPAASERHQFDKPDMIWLFKGQSREFGNLIVIDTAHDNCIDLYWFETDRFGTGDSTQYLVQCIFTGNFTETVPFNVSRLTLILLTPACQRASDNSANRIPLVVIDKSESPLIPDNIPQNWTAPLRISGSPPVMRIFVMPAVTAASATLTSSS